MTMLRATFPRDLEEGLNAHFGMTYRDLGDEWTGVFDQESSNKAWEEDLLQVGLGVAPVKPEGQGVSYDDGGEGWLARYTHETIALAFQITEEAIEDNLYDRLGPRYASSLARALKHTKEIKGAAVLNNATSASYPGGDAVALLSASHPLWGGGTSSNILATPADLSEAALETILIQIRKAVDDRGLPIALTPIRLVGPPELQFVSTRLLMSTGRVSTPDNDINAIKQMGIFTRPMHIMTRLTDSNAWFVKTDCPDGLKHFVRKRVARGMEEDWETGNARYKARERYSFGWSNWRAIYGSQGAT
jgi:hypothetical protein